MRRDYYFLHRFIDRKTNTFINSFIYLKLHPCNNVSHHTDLNTFPFYIIIDPVKNQCKNKRYIHDIRWNHHMYSIIGLCIQHASIDDEYEFYIFLNPALEMNASSSRSDFGFC